MFKQSLYNKNPNYPPTLNIKVPTSTIVSDENKNITKISSIEKGQYVNVDLEIGGIWCSNNKCGISWKAHSIQKSSYKPRQRVIKNEPLTKYAFDDDE